MHILTPVILESPFAAPTASERLLHKRYLHHAMRDSILNHSEAPFASHRLYTGAGILDDNIPDERRVGIEAGLVWGRFARRTVVYTDRGLSTGMVYGIERAKVQGRVIEMRSLEGWRDGEVPPESVIDAYSHELAALLGEANTCAIELRLARARHRQLRDMWHALEEKQRSELFEGIFT